MKLHATAHLARDEHSPWLVWLHGFLGSGEEWRPFMQSFPGWSQLWVDLPGHGGSAGIVVNGFDDVSARLAATLAYHGIARYWLVGYSLGGRVAMYHACLARPQGLQGLVVEGGNPGLETPAARRERAENDARWAMRLRSEPLEQVLDDWYRQPVFRHLSAQQRAALVELRRRNDPRALAAMLEATSLSRQPYLVPQLKALTIPFYYLCGEQDAKFRALANRNTLPLRTIPGVGHNAHRENPQAFSATLSELLHSAYEEKP
ncbi:2-succinyl-6-hydroxy-2,4-cyclohexadiene-1-carboxylate synthase [Jejubacter calystegiae]|uniref:2-succinyl-6-hydroxy-2,4-cyclohexadiene-1-carboxylate synthase n=1 Tax=Jejubacter calystegiae TaxID=2579935 RepID=A0A4P8YMT6_9ENTR|nr:2-succinyl-6-hydroxy-2,4-cyclohexadiene-1-carboxylate synthase [Jejubacter calystegiae]QCT22171.1 2-succinyl-6-hydroxy-2,4-cyclohexadiene-1-carboxylate synthase [Jejubacter calystegiae]